jgi:hypothetical protein
MAVFTRINGDAGGVMNSDQGRTFANATIINTGIAAPLTAYKIAGILPSGGGAANLAVEQTTGGAVESLLRIISGNATVLAYQTDTGAQLSVLVERSGWASDTALQTAIRQTTAGDGAGNIGATGNTWVGVATVTSTGGIKLA